MKGQQIWGDPSGRVVFVSDEQRIAATWRAVKSVNLGVANLDDLWMKARAKTNAERFWVWMVLCRLKMDKWGKVASTSYSLRRNIISAVIIIRICVMSSSENYISLIKRLRI